mmetsp:Transcript_4542/g.10686  ORF Transcript_4542/g.10686 Transcript_4542/m.10686 type:complete len:229 (+) Transcript_4542:428-1114(+)
MERTEKLEELALVAAEAYGALERVRSEITLKKPNTSVMSEEGPCPWQATAVARWGPRVLLANPPCWERFVASRLPVPVPKSPAGLLQERYADCPWKLLVACCLMSRVSSTETKERCIQAFFGAFPTPSDFFDGSGSPAAVLPLIDSLGLFETRFKSLVDLTTKFLSLPEFDCERDGIMKIYGVGDFGVTSFEIWTRGLGRALRPGDKNLSVFCSWLRQHGNRKCAGGP